MIPTPVSVVAGIGRAARSGILIKDKQHIESTGRIDMLALDKTGTLTEGKPSLVEALPLTGVGRNELLHWAAIAESGSEHPLGRPIVAAGRAEGEAPTPEAVEEVAGMGLVVSHEGRQIAAGNQRLFDKLGIGIGVEAEEALAEILGRGRTPIIVGLDGKIAGIFGLFDQHAQ